jgi:hypothetical protein
LNNSQRSSSITVSKKLLDVLHDKHGACADPPRGG